MQVLVSKCDGKKTQHVSIYSHYNLDTKSDEYFEVDLFIRTFYCI
jgi:hypothetical protein